MDQWYKLVFSTLRRQTHARTFKYEASVFYFTSSRPAKGTLDRKTLASELRGKTKQNKNNTEQSKRTKKQTNQQKDSSNFQAFEMAQLEILNVLAREPSSVSRIHFTHLTPVVSSNVRSYDVDFMPPTTFKYTWHRYLQIHG